ncbi:MAG TPA: hypothetical protein VLB27_06605, partial [candidate division Zixibacteria bacterium]|nr:hypothetical protein [candidate division Zixibacteria bacterium]
LYSKLGGETPEERADHSLLGRANAELYLTGSYDRGFSWAPPTNLTNTKTPHCSGSDSANVCASEAWATIGRDVSDIEIFYIRDFEADYYYRTGWTINDAMYLSFPGGTTDADFVCPLYAPLMLTALSVSPDCEYHAPGGGSAHETLTLTNNGNAPLEGEITVTAGAVWLSTLPSGPYQVSGGRNDFAIDLNLSAAALAEGLYAGEIQITHNDTTQPSPLVVPVDFFVVDDFHCPEGAIVKTGVNGNSVLSLETRSDGRIGAPDFYGGLWRDEGHSRAIFDASLLVAHGNQTPDTIVYHRFYRESDPGQYGLKALGDLVIDTADYSTGAGFAHATVQMTTADSSLGVDVIWSFPQRPDSANFVIAKYRLSNRTETTISDIALGVIA